MKEKYGMLKPLKYVSSNKHHKQVWEFLCGCGKIKETVFSDVKSGRIQSCGCMQLQTRINNGFLRSILLENTEFPGFKVLNRNTSESFKKKDFAMYVCECKCGKKFERKGTKILTGSVKRCLDCQRKHNGYVTQSRKISNQQLAGML